MIMMMMMNMELPTGKPIKNTITKYNSTEVLIRASKLTHFSTG